MTAAEYLAQLRIYLNDLPEDGEDGRWTDLELGTFLQAAVKEYSQDFPRERRMTFTADGTSDSFDIPTDLIDDAIHRIRFRMNDAAWQEVPRREVRSNYSNLFFETIGQELVFGYQPTDGTVFEIVYDGLHELPDAGASTVPSEDEDLIFTFAQFLAWRRVAGNDAALSRWKETGKRDDNPLIPQHVFLRRDYDDGVKRRRKPRMLTRKQALGARDRYGR